MSPASSQTVAAYAPIDYAAFLPELNRIAVGFCQHFPYHLADREDFTQAGFLGLVTVRAKDNEPVARLRHRQKLAAQRQMIDLARALRSTSPGAGCKTLEVLVDDIAFLADVRRAPHIDTYFVARDLYARTRRLSSRDQDILRARLRGETMMQVAQHLHVTEGRICQMEKGIIATLQEDV